MTGFGSATHGSVSFNACRLPLLIDDEEGRLTRREPPEAPS